jgi:competence CoiA-like predicted nuclease
MRNPLIKYAYDGETGEMYDSDILFETAKKSAEARNKYGLRLIKPFCCECDQPLGITMNRLGHGFFKHHPNHSYCILSQENLSITETTEYNNKAKESHRHKYLKNRIGDLLKQIIDIDANSVFIDEFFINDNEEKRKPDVYCVYKGYPLAFEIQLSSLSNGEILSRKEFYKRNKIYLIWILDEFNTHNQRMLDKDIKYLNEYQNVFQLNEKAATFELNCHYKKPFLHYDGEIRCRWENKNLSLNELHFDGDYNVYYFDYQSEDRKLNDIVEETRLRREEDEKRGRAMTKIEPIIRDIRYCHNYNVQNYNKINNDLKSLNEYEVEVFRDVFQSENKKFVNLTDLLDNASELESAYYQFVVSSPEVGIDFGQFKEKTILMSILGNEKLRISVIIGLFQNGYILSEKEKSFIKETKPTKGIYNYIQLYCLIYWFNKLEHKCLISTVCTYHRQLFTVLSAIEGRIYGLGFNNMVSVANNAIEHYKSCWGIIEMAFRKNANVWNTIIKATSFAKKYTNFDFNQITLDQNFEALCRDLFPELWE